jgi:ATP-dependent Clp protease ATP-binding subunit ClpC
LTEKLRRSPYSVVLFDEIEKAHPDVFNVLLQVFEDGILTDAGGQTVDCRNAIFIMTSNLGARAIQKTAALGFQAGSSANRDRVESEVMGEVKRAFAPEFINRLDELIIFDELTDDDLYKILDLQVARLNQITAGRGIHVLMSDEARRWLVEKTCADRKYGARPLKRALQRYVEDELSEAIIQGGLEPDSIVEVGVSGDGLAFRRVVDEALNAVPNA